MQGRHNFDDKSDHAPITQVRGIISQKAFPKRRHPTVETRFRIRGVQPLSYGWLLGGTDLSNSRIYKLPERSVPLVLTSIAFVGCTASVG